MRKMWWAQIGMECRWNIHPFERSKRGFKGKKQKKRRGEGKSCTRERGNGGRGTEECGVWREMG